MAALDRHFLRLAALSMIGGLLLPAAHAQGNYPARPIRLILDFPVGGPSDVLGRAIGQKLTEALGQQVVCDNRPGANGAVAYGVAAKAPADGYTLVWLSTPFPLNAALRTNLPYDSFRDLRPIAQVANYENVLFIFAQLSVHTVPEFIAYAKSRNGAMPYASSGSGSVQHLAMEQFRQLAGFQALHVPFTGSAPALLELVAGRVDSSITLPPAAMPHVKSGRLRALAVASDRRLSTLPDVPTLTEVGYPVLALGWGGIAAPHGVPQPIVQRISREVEHALTMTDVRERIESFGGSIRYRAPEDFARFIRGEYERWKPVIKQAGVRIGD
jgi:tripartite-type tricarboxylate transporter receptor subunit TctC